MANPPERLRLDSSSRDRTSDKYLAFDIETANAFPDTADDWRQFRPLGICCAATLTSDGEQSLWYSRSADGRIANQLSVGDAQALVAHLQKAVRDGYVICSWNGLGFDFDILAEESGMYDECRSLALNHVDMLFHFFCLKGFTVGLDRVCKAMGLQGKPMGMSGIDIPKMWSDGRYEHVLEYVSQDVRATLAIAQAVKRQRFISWVTRAGAKKEVPIGDWLPPLEAVRVPEPDVSWMKDPWPRSRFIGWTGYR
ncbi:MAG: ribonuclease H-like domain-containing protein [Chloroflexota bacterium]